MLSAAETVPTGFVKLERVSEAYISKDWIVLLGYPESDDENHNCDVMGCGSTGPHVLFRFALAERHIFGGQS